MPNYFQSLFVGTVHELFVVGVNELLKIRRRDQWRIILSDIVLYHEHVKSCFYEEVKHLKVKLQCHGGKVVHKFRVFNHLNHEIRHSGETPTENKNSTHEPEQCNLIFEPVPC